VPVSAHLEWNLDGLIDRIWDYLDLIRIYTKPKGREPGKQYKKMKTFITNKPAILNKAFFVSLLT
jgi:ribosome-interacting GTPase 1